MNITSSFLKEGIYYCQLFMNQVQHDFLHSINLLYISLFLFASLFLRAMFIVMKERKLKNNLRSNIVTNYKFKKILKKLKLTNKTILIKDKKNFAFCLGINPKIYISTALFNSISNKELEAVLRHEKYHLESKDTILSFIILVFKPIFLLFPILSDIERNYKTAREIRADREALAGLGNQQPLLSVIEKILTAPKFNLSYQAVAGFDAIELRIEALIKGDFKFTKYRKRNILITVLTLTLFLFFTVSSVWAMSLHSEKEGGVCISSDKLYTPANLSIDNR